MKKGSLNWSFASSKILPVAHVQQGIKIQSTLIWWTTLNNEFHWMMGAQQTFGVIICVVTSLGGFSSAEEMNGSAANRFSWDNTENSWSFCSIPVSAAEQMFLGFRWTLGKIRDSGKSWFLRIGSCCSTEQLPDKCKHVAGVFHEFFPWVEMLCPPLQGFYCCLHQDEVGKVPWTGCRKFQWEQGNVGKGGEAEQDTIAWTIWFHPGSSSRVASTPCFLSSSAENIPQIFPENLPFHGSSKDLVKETKDLGYS